MAKRQAGLQEMLKNAHAYFFLLKGEEVERLKLWEIREDSIVIDMPMDAPLRKTMLGYIPLLDDSGVYQMEGEVNTEALPDQMPNTLQLMVDTNTIRQVNRRVYPRVSFTPPLAVKIAIPKQERSFSGHIVNFSAGGLRVETSEELPVDQPLTFHFQIEGEDEIYCLSPKGKILYDIPLEQGHSYGIKFLTEQAESSFQIKEASVTSIAQTVDLMRLVNKLRMMQQA